MVSFAKLSTDEEEVFPFHFYAIIPCAGKEEAISYQITANFSADRIAKLVAAFNIITDQRPGTVLIKDVSGSTEFLYASAKN